MNWLSLLPALHLAASLPWLGRPYIGRSYMDKLDLIDFVKSGDDLQRALRCKSDALNGEMLEAAKADPADTLKATRLKEERDRIDCIARNLDTKYSYKLKVSELLYLGY